MKTKMQLSKKKIQIANSCENKVATKNNTIATSTKCTVCNFCNRANATHIKPVTKKC
jgi:hypothetical protein